MLVKGRLFWHNLLLVNHHRRVGPVMIFPRSLSLVSFSRFLSLSHSLTEHYNKIVQSGNVQGIEEALEKGACKAIV
jgi:hypothetical protein